MSRWPLRRYPALALLGLVPLLALAAFAFLVSARAVDTLVHRSNDAAAVITAAMVEREFDHWAATLTSHAGFPSLSAAVAGGDVPEVRRRLAVFVTAHDRLDRAFVTDTTGLLWVDFPIATESLGERFAHRDWFRGVSSAGAPYVSEVYRRHAEPAIPVVAVAAPVRSPATGAIAGYLVAQVRLDGLSDLLGRVDVGADGLVLLRDHAGALAAHPDLDLRVRPYLEYADVLPARPDADGPARGRYTDPVTGEAALASAVAARVGSHRWTVISQQPVAVALAPVRGLAIRLGAAGLLLAGVMGALLWGLAAENARRLRAERELVALNDQLEARVEERTRALKEREDQLLQAQKMEAVGQLAGGVAHDFNNLLTVILGAADYLLARLPDGVPERQEVDAVQAAAERAADLTGQLLAFSRKQVVQPKVLDVNESVERMRGILERVLGEDIALVWRLKPGLHPVKFDPGKIEQVIMNLAVNARDAMPEGGTLTIQTANVELDEAYVEEHVDARSGPHVMLAVSDTGVGMDAETRKRIFDPFYTTKGLGHGTGLGLSTVYGIVRQGGGNIWVYSEPGHGTTFKVYLPRTDEAPRPPSPAEETAPSADEPGTGTILVVEDEAPLRALLVRVLGEAGYEVLEAEDAGSAVRALHDRLAALDLLLTDVVLPDTNGPALAAELREAQPGLRVLYMSGYTDDTIVHHAALEDDAIFIEKPFRPQDLLRKIREELTRPAG